MNTAQGNLVVMDPHTSDRKVFWKGVEVRCVGIKVVESTVTIFVEGDPVLADMKDAGINVKEVGV
jgi:hypothetical protein